MLTHRTEIRNLAHELGNDRSRGLLPLELQLLRVLLLSSHKNALLAILHLAEHIITSYASHAIASPTASVNLLDSGVLDELSDVPRVYTSSRHNLQLISSNALHLANCVLALDDSVALHVKRRGKRNSTRRENAIHAQLNARLLLSIDTLQYSGCLQHIARHVNRTVERHTTMNHPPQLHLKGRAASIRRRFFSMSTLPSFVRQPITTPLQNHG